MMRLLSWFVRGELLVLRESRTMQRGLERWFSHDTDTDVLFPSPCPRYRWIIAVRGNDGKQASFFGSDRTEVSLQQSASVKQTARNALRSSAGRLAQMTDNDLCCAQLFSLLDGHLHSKLHPSLDCPTMDLSQARRRNCRAVILDASHVLSFVHGNDECHLRITHEARQETGMER